MNWYYAIGQEQKGPVEEGELQNLKSAGKLNGDTLVWREGMADWKPLKEVFGGAAGLSSSESRGAAAASATAVAMSTSRVAGAAAAEAAAGGEKMARCAHSGAMLPLSKMIKYGDSWVGVEHKDAFVQRLQEGGEADGMKMKYAGFWIRVAAKFIDGIIVSIVTLPPYVAANLKLSSMQMQAEPDPAEIQKWILIVILIWLLMVAVQVAYSTWMVGKFQATLGKMALGLKVVNADGSRVSYRKAFARFFAEWLSGMTICIGYIIAAFDDEKRTLHDHVCTTRVIWKK